MARTSAFASAFASAVAAWLAFALAAAVPASAVIVVAVRAASAESARAREEQAAGRAAAAVQAKRDVEAAIARAKDVLRAAPADATRARLADELAAARPSFADVVIVDADGALVVPPAPSAEPRTSDACASAASALATPARRAEARRRILADCKYIRAAGSGRHLWPLLALEDPDAGAAVAAWAAESSDRLAPTERAVLRARADALPDPARAGVTAALDRAPSLHGTLESLLADTVGDASLDGDVSVRRGRAISVTRAFASGARAGYVVHEASLERAPPLPADLTLVARAASGAASLDDVTFAPSLVLRVAARDPSASDALARRSANRILAATVACVVVSLALAAALFARARRAQRLAELRTDFVAAVSHELRTPLASVRMLSELLERGDVADAERREVETTIAGEARRLSVTLDRMLRFGALARGKLGAELQPTRVAGIVAAAVERFQAAKPGARVVVEVDDGLDADADEGLLGLALDNLLANAAKYAPEGGPYRVAARVEGGDVVLSLSDRGPGLDRRAQARVFLPFERVDDRLSRATEGTGVGLALVRGIARAHGGDATVESAPGQGATFVVRFPKTRRSR